ncbi:hypothetical protein [Furfurilactobacillus siliginis]|uniref:Uncharacterized protein n=1 Tax=Furfurilactobacillus siliginis TaxID=348151 RepID=A0A0R2LD85_9LACO|nr:hypothetical protein [Furfurilactobacillus siliginis]KRN97180.1 hypothetical protein IV55_GL000101 [Furfurilactobacillus siliginis]GEK28641.1 hypothetical protein LSI01_09520 [Furfurilactobacillus siliginis]
MRQQNEHPNLIIRKRPSIFAMLRRAIILVILWLVTGFIIYINVSFLLGRYSDALVADYLVLNLSLHLYKVLAVLVVLVAALITFFGTLHINALKRRAKQREQDNA